jgi:DNA-binding GntR family transcriptional regulator
VTTLDAHDPEADPQAAPSAVGAQDLPLTDVVRDALREAIAEGRFRPGDRLIEGKLAELFGVSRNPVREALKALANEGVVTIAPRRGAVVAALSESEAAEVVELRAALEGLCARLAARRLDPDAADELSTILARGDELAGRGDLRGLSRLNDAFHAELARAGRNRFLADFMRTLRTKTQWLFDSISEERAGRSWAEHAGILRAVLDRDEEMAALLASRHVTNVGGGMTAARTPEAAPGGDEPGR